jgi:hypothetical protein
MAKKRKRNSSVHEDPNLWQVLLLWCVERKEQVSIFIGMALFGAWGGLMSYIRDQRTKKVAIRITEGVLEALSASFVGVLIGMACLSLTDNQMIAMAAAGWAGHEGTRKIFRIIDNLIKKRFDK